MKVKTSDKRDAALMLFGMLSQWVAFREQFSDAMDDATAIEVECCAEYKRILAELNRSTKKMQGIAGKITGKLFPDEAEGNAS